LSAKGGFLYATNFRAGTIDVFGPTGSDGLFTPATTDGGFADPDIPAGYAPFGIANVDGDLFVTYAQQNAAKHDDVAGPGHGFVMFSIPTAICFAGLPAAGRSIHPGLSPAPRSRLAG